MLNKILIVIPSFKIGGTNTALKSFLPIIKSKIPNIDVFAITAQGPNKEYISKYANLLGVDGEVVITNKKSLKQILAIIVKKAKKTLEIIGIDISSFVFRNVAHRLENNNYDLVISFQEGIATHFVSYFNKTPKIAWVHCDYKAYLKASNKNPEIERYSKFKKVICVSKYTMQQFATCIPNVEVSYLHNLISTKSIIEKSFDRYNEKFDTTNFTILSVGRLNPIKRFEIIPHIIDKLKKKGIKDFRWYILGNGDEIVKNKIKHLITEYCTPELILLGEISNPYPYFKKADLFVSTSISEACPYVINEAKILHIPIVSTDFGSVYEFIEDGVNGLISPIETISEKIESMILDKELYGKIKKNISDFEYDNNLIIDKLFNEILEIE